MQKRYEADLEASPRLVQRLFVIPLRGLLSATANFPGYLCMGLSSFCARFIAIGRRLSNASSMQFLKEQRADLDFPGDKYLWILYIPIYRFFVIPVLVLVNSLNGVVNTSRLRHNASHVPMPLSHTPLVTMLCIWSFCLLSCRGHFRSHAPHSMVIPISLAR